MKCRVLVVFFFLSCEVLSAQNIVTNPSFEEYTVCPHYYNQSESLGCTGWDRATRGTVDYFNSCNSSSIGRLNPYVGVPFNDLGYQAAYEGHAYTGIQLGSEFNNYGEYLITTIPPLEIGAEYEVTIHVSLADSVRYATDAIGVLFTTYGSPDPGTASILNVTPQIDYTSYGVITDSIHWTTLSATFIADSAFTHLIIGRFNNNSQSSVIEVNRGHILRFDFIYYYVDNVSVIKTQSAIVFGGNNGWKEAIYPNPASNVLNISMKNPITSVDILNTVGQNLGHYQSSSPQAQIDISALSAGIYFIRINGTQVKKFTKQ